MFRLIQFMTMVPKNHTLMFCKQCIQAANLLIRRLLIRRLFIEAVRGVGCCDFEGAWSEYPLERPWNGDRRRSGTFIADSLSLVVLTEPV